MRQFGLIGWVLGALAVIAMVSAGPAFAVSEPVLISPPTISGVAQVGKTLTTTDSVWSAEGFQMRPESRVWDRCTGLALSDCKALGNGFGGYENSPTYQVTSADLGAFMRVWNGLTVFEWRVQAWSEPTGAVTAETSPLPSATKPSNTALPKIKGRAKVGVRLTVSNGSWKGSSPITYSYQWKRCNGKGRNCKAIKGATRHSFTPGRKYVGTRLKAAVTASNSAGKTTAASKASKVVSS
jgi:hypothetical protein